MSTTVSIDLKHVSRGLGIPLRQVQTVVELLDEGNTVPFITRYRKDQTGGLDEEQIREIQGRLAKARQLLDRKQTILRSIESQGKLTPELTEHILAAGTTKRLEDLYLPFKPRKQTLATAARARGLELLAREILTADPLTTDLDARARDFVNPDKQVTSAADALLGAGHILAEQFSEQAELRQRLREVLQRTGRISSTQIGGETKGGEKPEKSAAAAPGAAGSASTAAIDGTSSLDTLTAEDAVSQHVADGVVPPEVMPYTGEPAEHALPATEGATLDNEAIEYSAATLPASAVVASETIAETTPAILVETLVEASALVMPPAATPVQLSLFDAETEAATAGTPPAIELTSPPTDGLETPAAPVIVETAAGEVLIDATVDSAIATAAAEPAAPSAGQPAAATQSAVARAEPRLTGRAAAKAREKAAKQAKKELKKKRLEEMRIKAFRDYFSYSEELRKMPPHRVLAINRGERAKVLRVRLEYDLDAMTAAMDEALVPAAHPHADYLRGCARDALQRLILPSLERELRRELTDRAEGHAVEVFAKNLRNLLLQPPVHDRRVLAIDPGFKSGCKLAALDQFGNLLEHGVIYLVGKPERRDEAKQKIVELVDRYQLTVIAVGNGTACRAVEDFVAEMLSAELKEKGVAYVIVNEAGASVYSTSRIGREEFPDYDASLRGAISIGRRLQDPLSELVKIEPANIGVGLYQHDVKAKHLETSLDDVVESCVNYVGVEVNMASPALLRYVSGLNQLTARRVYEYRREHGPFRNRQQLRDVPGFGEASFVQAAGFLKITGGDNPLDATWIHPESYTAAEQLLARLGGATTDLRDKPDASQLAERVAGLDREALARELGVGALTLADILAQVARPGRDPREDLPAPVFKQGVLKLEDLVVGMELTGTVLNVVDFGAFVDIGMHDSGLVHVSHLADRYVRDPHEVVAVGDIVKVWVLEVDRERRRVSLTMVRPGSERPRPPRHEHGGGHARAHDAAAAGEGGEGQPQARQGQQGRGQGRPPRAQGPSAGRPRVQGGAPGGAGNRQNEAGPHGDRPPRTGGPRDDHSRPPRQGDRSRFRQQGGPARPRYEPPKPKPKPLVPITDGMKAGKEPMRTFGDLLQFFEHTHEVKLVERPAETGKDKKPKRSPPPKAPADGDAAPKAVQPPSDHPPGEAPPSTVPAMNAPAAADPAPSVGEDAPRQAGDNASHGSHANSSDGEQPSSAS